MAANNYFGFTHGGTQYGTATASAAYGGQTGYAVAPAATAATYGTQRAAATGYDTAYQAAATQAAHAHAAAQHVAAAQSAYDVSKTAYYQQAAAAYPAPAAPQPQPAYDAAAAKPAYTTPAAAYQQYGGGARAAGGAAPAAKPTYGSVYTATSAAAAVAASATYPPHSYTAPQPHAHAHTHAPKQQANRAYTNTYDTALYNAATMYVAQQTKPAATAPAHSSGWKTYNKSGGSNANQRRPKAPPKALQLHYCDVCRISCAGPQTYREHLEGQKHKKKEAAVKLAAAGAHASTARSSASLRCELCDVTCTGSDAYAAHVRGIKHQKVVKLHTMLGKPIPSTEPTKLGGAAKKTVGATSKIAFVSSGGLSTVGGGGVKAEGEGAAAAPAVSAAAAAAAAAAAEPDTDDGADDAEPEIQPVGQDYIEEIRADDGKAISFNCKLCDCRFNDPNAKEMHMKGRRHRLQYKKKVQPDLEVKVKPSLRQRQLAEQKAQRLMVREEMWARRRMHMMEMGMEGMEEAYWGGEGGSWRGAPPHHAPYGHAPPYAHAHGHAPHGVAPPPPRRPDTSDDKHVMAKHADIYPAEPELHHIQRLVSHTERALKGLSDALAELARPHLHKQRAPAAAAAPAAATAPAPLATPAATAKAGKDDGKPKEDKTEGKEDGRDNQLFSFANEGESANGPSAGGAGGGEAGAGAGAASGAGGAAVAGGVQGAVSSALGATAPGGRALKGVMRVGLLAKGLLLKGDRDVRLVVLCHDRPTVTLLKRVAADLPSHLNKVKGTEEVKYEVKLQPAEGAVSVTDGTYTVLVSLTSPVMREMEGGGDKRDDKDVLPRQKCLDALAALRHAKWFQARAATLQSCVMLIRIMRDVCRRCPVWAAVRPWAMELLAACVVGSAGGALSPGEALRRLMEAVASGLLLEHGPGLLDPCEKEPLDALGAITPQQREDLTASAQTFLRQIVYRQIHKVLDMELLPKPKFSNTPAWKNPRKRRRSQNETESDGKVVKTEEKMDTSAGIEAK